MSTPHNKAEKGEIAKTVLMPGDPLRAKYIAETYLSDVHCFNSVRNMLGFTGKMQGKEISVMGGGRPSASIPMNCIIFMMWIPSFVLVLPEPYRKTSI